MSKSFPGKGLVLVIVFFLGLGVGSLANRSGEINKPILNPVTPTVHAGEGSVSRVAKGLSSSVIGVINYSKTGDFFNQKTREKTGSGVVIDNKGLVVTNNHVVEGADRLVAVLPGGGRREAVLVGRDARTDLALIRIKGKTDLSPAPFGDSNRLVVGQPVAAIGNPLGLEFAQSVTAGIISGLNRVITTEEGFTLKLIQTDAAINPGNSGGPLVDLSGRVVGINTAKIILPGFEGMGFAIPSNQVRKIAEDLNKHGKVIRPLLGVKVVKEVVPDEAKYYRLPISSGVAVIPIKGGPAARAGLRDYDIIKAVNGNKVKTGAELQEEIFSRSAGEVVKLDILRLPSAEGQKSRHLSIRVKLENQE